MEDAGLKIGVMEQVLDIRAAQHRVILANIANEDTPGFRARELHFSDALAAARQAQPVTVQTTHPGHLPGIGKTLEDFVHPAEADDLPLDKNSVNMEREMAKLSDNAMHYNTAATLVAKEYRELINAIRGGQ